MIPIGYRETGAILYEAHSASGGDHLQLNSIMLGSYFDMPSAPNLSLTLGHEYDKTKELTSYNGSTFSNTFWSSPPKWGEKLGAWELADPDSEYVPEYKLSRSGRRTWQLQFSFMDQSDLFGSNQSLSRSGWGVQTELDADDYDSQAEAFKYNLLEDDNFFSAVWEKTLGGSIPMIMQMDNTNNSPDQFTICRFKSNTLKATETAPNFYDISVSIEEVF